MTSTSAHAARYPLVILDMDGTLTQELLDFSLIRREVGVPDGFGILEYILRLPPGEKEKAAAILHHHEITAANGSTLHEGAAELVETLRGRGVLTALLTRNSQVCTTAVLARHRLTLDYVATRENKPHKPHGDSILNICRHFGMSPGQTLMVGDYLYDLQAARNAGTHSVLVNLKAGELPKFAPLATYVVRELAELMKIIFKE